VIGYKQVAEACTRLDALGDEGVELPQICADRDVDADELLRAAQQRALRIGMIMDGRDPHSLSRTEVTRVTLSPETTKQLNWLALAFVDGFVAAREARDPANRIQRFPGAA
jgi:hypothetical protein